MILNRVNIFIHITVRTWRATRSVSDSASLNTADLCFYVLKHDWKKWKHQIKASLWNEMNLKSLSLVPFFFLFFCDRSEWQVWSGQLYQAQTSITHVPITDYPLLGVCSSTADIWELHTAVHGWTILTVTVGGGVVLSNDRPVTYTDQLPACCNLEASLTHRSSWAHFVQNFLLLTNLF